MYQLVCRFEKEKGGANSQRMSSNVYIIWREGCFLDLLSSFSIAFSICYPLSRSSYRFLDPLFFYCRNQYISNSRFSNGQSGLRFSRFFSGQREQSITMASRRYIGVVSRSTTIGICRRVEIVLLNNDMILNKVGVGLLTQGYGTSGYPQRLYAYICLYVAHVFLCRALVCPPIHLYLPISAYNLMQELVFRIFPRVLQQQKTQARNQPPKIIMGLSNTSDLNEIWHTY